MTELDHPQGHYIDQIIAYANLVIPEAETSSMRCASTRIFDHVCKFIAANENVPVSRVYPALRYIGYNYRYHTMKNDSPDPLYEMGETVKRCILSGNIDIMDFAVHDDVLFVDTKSSMYRVKKSVSAVAIKDAGEYGVRVSQLNLYNALTGLDVVVSNEPDYILLREMQIFIDPLKSFDKIKRMINLKTIGLKTMLDVR